MKKITAILPVYNDEANIEKNIREAIVDFALMLDYDIEIIVVDDGSTDKTLEILNKIKDINVLTYPRNVGKGCAFFSGCKFAQGDYILLLDSDLQVSPTELPVFLSVMKLYKADAVIGNKRHRYSKTHYPLIRSIVSKVYNFMIRKMFNVDLRDTQCGFKLFKKEAINKVIDKIRSKRFAFDIELLVALRENSFRVADAPVFMKEQRNSGSVNLRNIWHTFRDTVIVWIRKKKGYYAPRN